ncbi:uncharacterized protein LOC105398488 [Plutella xylostella]|uniref:uncharacterized protein LOC105398488 n=1 Tax=Plutella xylostella TaxID=51655 RepID=UPI002032E5B0|nr:uncharacterized protein LOC105398488 [Plutella xylostella]
MNFTPELSAFQGVIISADNVNQFSKITARGGNEETILTIVSSLYTFLHEKQYLSNDGVTEKAKSELRKFTFYLLLNADFSILEELVEMPGIDMVIWTVPTITKCLICEMIWGLNMEPFLYEVISFCQSSMALQVVQPFIDSLKYSPLETSLAKIKLLSAACYRHISRMNFFTYDNSFLFPTLTEFYETLLRCITYFVTPPRPERIERLPDDEKYKYMGNNLITVIKLILECFTLYTSLEKFETEGFEDMYLCTIKPESIQNRGGAYRPCDLPEGSVFQCVQKCNSALVDKCMAVVMEVSVDVFCAWSEFEENGKTMQQSVGEMCYLLLSKLTKISAFSDHPIKNMLPQISCKPVDIHDIIKVADTETIIENVSKGLEHKVLWLQALIEKDELCQNMQSIACLTANIDFLKGDQCAQLMKKIIHYVEENSAADESVKLLAINIFSKCNHSSKEMVLEEHFKNNVLNNSLETSQLNDMQTEIFNKLVATPDADITHVLSVFIQNPYLTYTKILNTAIENNKQCDIMLRVMSMLSKYTNHYYKTDTEACLVKSIEKYPLTSLESDKQRSSFVHFIVELRRAEILTAAKLLLLVIMPSLHRAIVQKDCGTVSVQVRLLSGAYSLDELLQYRAPVLAMLAQVLEAVRWTLPTFTGDAPTALEESLQLQMKLFKAYNGVVPAKDMHWLKSKLVRLGPMNMYYYRDIWNPPGDNYIEIISGKKEMSNDELVVLLAKVLCSASPTEWSEVWDSLRCRGETETLDILYNAFSLITVAESENRTDSTRACMLYCLRNLALVTKDKVSTVPLSDSQVSNLLDKAVTIMNIQKDVDVEDVSTAILPLLSYIAEKKRTEYTVDTHNIARRIKYESFAILVRQIFTNANNC